MFYTISGVYVFGVTVLEGLRLLVHLTVSGVLLQKV